jgi:hypothetical protein
MGHNNDTGHRAVDLSQVRLGHSDETLSASHYLVLEHIFQHSDIVDRVAVLHQGFATLGREECQLERK